MSGIAPIDKTSRALLMTPTFPRSESDSPLCNENSSDYWTPGSLSNLGGDPKTPATGSQTHPQFNQPCTVKQKKRRHGMFFDFNNIEESFQELERSLTEHMLSARGPLRLRAMKDATPRTDEDDSEVSPISNRRQRKSTLSSSLDTEISSTTLSFHSTVDMAVEEEIQDLMGRIEALLTRVRKQADAERKPEQRKANRYGKRPLAQQQTRRPPPAPIPQLSSNKPHDIRDWLEQVELVGAINQWSLEDTFAQALVVATPKVRDWYWCNKQELPTWESFCEGLLTASYSITLHEAILTEMESATWDPEDQYFLYHAYIQRLAILGNIPSTIATRHMIRVLPQAWRCHLAKVPFLSISDVLNHVQHLIHKFGNPRKKIETF